MSDPLSRILKADKPQTLAGVPTGFLPWLSADLARAAHGTGKGGRAVIIAADEAAMRALADTVPVFAPEVEVLTLPAWDCLPYDRASPALRVMAERLATLQSLQATRWRPCIDLAKAPARSSPEWQARQARFDSASRPEAKVTSPGFTEGSSAWAAASPSCSRSSSASWLAS